MLANIAVLLADVPLVPEPGQGSRSWVFYGAAAGAVVLVVALVAVLIGRRKRPAHDPEAGMGEDLAEYPPPPPLKASKQLTLQGHPVRVRLVVVAPVGRRTVADDGHVEPLLDMVVPGLGAAVSQDKARVRQWPLGLSVTGFEPMFFRRVRRPEPPGRRSRWILLAGHTRAGSRPLLLGLALWLEQPSDVGNVAVGPEEWNDLLRVEAVR
jgi:hypothetical protein